MQSRGVVIAGGGLAAQRCAERLRRRGYDAPIRMVCEEPQRPYDRPPLSKEMLAGQPVRRLNFRDEDWYADNEVELLLGERAAHLDAPNHLLELESGSALGYDHLLIATGAAPRRLPAADRFSNTHYLRTVADASALRGELKSGARLAIVGAGFIGLEVAATARRLGVEVTIVEMAELPLAGILGARLGRWFAEMHADEGVSLLLACEIIDFAGNGRVEQLELASGETVDCDSLVVAIGVAPSLGWLNGSGLDPTGIVVDPAGRTGLPDVYAAGDVCRGSEHWETAVQQGVAAAGAMLGEDPAPSPPASFWSDQYGVRIQYLGNARLADDVHFDGDPAERDFTALFTRDGQPVAALLAGRPRALPEMRRLIAKGTEQ
jgi:3-phenylpropionate/trans-cinnamate dioxygenase ferredoxin reductase component